MATFHDTYLYFYNKWVATTTELNEKKKKKKKKSWNFVLFEENNEYKPFVVLKVWIAVFCSQEN